jgi:hypothetical protein
LISVPGIQAPQPDYHLQQEKDLIRLVFTGGTLDPAAWEELALSYECFDRQERATMLRRSLLSLQTEYNENLKLKEEYKEKYHLWETLGLNLTLLITSD